MSTIDFRNSTILKEDEIDKKDFPTPSSNANMMITLENIRLLNKLPAQDGHRIVVYPSYGENQKVYIYGGGFFDNAANLYIYKDILYIYDVNTNTITNINERLRKSTDIPPPLIGFSMIVRDISENPSFVLFGGTTSGRVRTKDVYEYSFGRNEWKKLHCTGLNTCISGHTAHWHAEADHLYTFFGKNESNDFIDIVYRLDLKTQNWAVVQKKDISPSTRSSHSSVLWKNNYVIIFGGELDDNSKFNDTWMFNIASEEWTELEAKGDIPEARCFHSSVLYGDFMFIYGGHPENSDLFMLDLNSLIWKKLRIDPYIPNEYKAHGHSMCIIKQPKCIYPKLLIYGGSNIKVRQHDQFYTLELRDYAKRFQSLLCTNSFTDIIITTYE